MFRSIAFPYLFKFQSAPGFSAGRNRRGAGDEDLWAQVSIRSRLFGREKLAARETPLVVDYVSIRSRLFGREKRSASPRPTAS